MPCPLLRCAVPLIASLCLLLSACGSGTRPVEAAGRAVITGDSAPIRLLDVATSRERCTLLLDADGAAHLFAASPATREVHHLVVTRSGVTLRETVARDASPATLSAAFDAAGRLHLLLDGQHMLHDTNGWQTVQDTPWAAAGLRASGARFVPGADGLVWAFLVDGGQVGAKGRWDWFGFGGAPAGILLPWHSQSAKLVITAEAALADPVWHVIDPADNRDASDVHLAMDRNGIVHVAFDAWRHLLIGERESRHATIALALVSDSRPGAGAQAPRLHMVASRALAAPDTGPGLSQAALAADPDNGRALLLRAHKTGLLLHDQRSASPVTLPFAKFWEPRLAAAGDGAFHALVVGTAHDEWVGRDFPILYLRFANGRWSGARELGLANVATFWGFIWDAVQLASDGGATAFAVWPTADGLLGRWITTPP